VIVIRSIVVKSRPIRGENEACVNSGWKKKKVSPDL